MVMNRFYTWGLITSLLLLFSSLSEASAIYLYTGSNYTDAQSPYDTSMNIEATIELPSLLAPNLSQLSVTPDSFSLFDGVNTLDGSNADFAIFAFSTDSSGNITDWDFLARDIPFVFGAGADIFSNSTFSTAGFVFEAAHVIYCPHASCGGSFNVGAEGNTNIAGTWSVTTVPVPAAAWLFGSGLLGLIGIARRKKSA